VGTLVLSQDPRFGGGMRSLTRAFWDAAVDLGRDPELAYLSRGHALSLLTRRADLGVVAEEQAGMRGRAWASILPELDGFNQALAALRMRRAVERADSVWVVAATATYGYPAPRSSRPYACWIATSFGADTARRRAVLPWARRYALTLNAPVITRLERDVLRNAELLFAMSPSSQEEVAEAAGLDLDRVGILPIPVDLDEFRPLPDDTWLAGLEAPTVAFVGRANDPRKNVRLLLDAWPGIRKALPRATLRLIGQPPGTTLPTGVDMRGDVESVPDNLRDASLLVLPSFQEGFGIVVAGALAAGVPVLVTRCGGPEELVRSSGGGIVLRKFAPKEIVDTAVELLTDPDRLLALRTGGRSFVEREHSKARLRELLADAFARLDAAGPRR
jgi:glycosyltransferase involved in cell wall biosynthesis